MFLGAGKNYYINGALKAKGLKQKYNCINQSLTHIFNNADQYKHPDKQFFDFIWANRVGMDSRFLKIKFDGIMQEQFTDKFNMKKEAEKNKMKYIAYAKMLLWLQEYTRTDEYKTKYNVNSILKLKGRRTNTYDKIINLCDMYAKNQSEMDLLVETLDQCILNYRIMVDNLGSSEVIRFKEEEVVE